MAQGFPDRTPFGLMAHEHLVDHGEATLLPGLIDLHQHLAFDASTDPVAHLNRDDDHALVLRMRLAAQQALSVGITTIRDLGDRNYLSLSLRDRFATGAEFGPRLLCSGPPITTPQGHCWFLGGEVESIDQLRLAARERAARGVDVIGVMASGGNMTPTVGPHESQLGRAELAAALEEAHTAGLPLAVHAHGTVAVVDALTVGADSIEHCTFFGAEGVDRNDAVLAELAASPSVISMTAAVVVVSPGVVHVGAGAPAGVGHRRAAGLTTHSPETPADSSLTRREGTCRPLRSPGPTHEPVRDTRASWRHRHRERRGRARARRS